MALAVPATQRDAYSTGTEGPEAATEVAEPAGAADRTAFASEGTIPAVQPLPPPLTSGGRHASASDRAFGAHATAPALAAGAAHGTGRGATAGAAHADPTALTAPVTRQIAGVTVYAPAGTHVAAIDVCAGFIRQEIGKNQYAQAELAKARATIVIIPARMAMTDLPQFADLKGKQTFDGRDWAKVRGSGGTAAADGSFAIGVAEENLILVRNLVADAAAPKPYPAGYSVGMHELAHAVNSRGMTKDQQARLNALYAKHAKADPGDKKDTFTDRYAASNVEEYFAQATNAYFGKNQMAGNHNGKAWLYAHDPELYAFLVELYESSYDEKGHRAP